jgi:deoxyribodipyrimidine photo-lyase
MSVCSSRTLLPEFAVETRATALHIPFYCLIGEPKHTIAEFVKSQKAGLLVCDFSPLRIGVEWRKSIAASLAAAPEPIPLHEVDAHNVVPVWVASDKLEYAARTIRPKITTKLATYLVEYPVVKPQTADFKLEGAVTVGASIGLSPASAGAGSSVASVASGLIQQVGPADKALEVHCHGVDWDGLLATLPIDRSVSEITFAIPGFQAGMMQLQSFCGTIKTYGEKRNDPTLNAVSGLSPWLHYGQISPARCALEAMKVRKAATPVRAAPHSTLMLYIDICSSITTVLWCVAGCGCVY